MNQYQDNTRLMFSEPERYELDEPSYYQFRMSRRQFGQVLGAGLMLCVVTPNLLAQRRGRGAVPGPSERLHIGENGVITVLTSKVEVGQGSRTQITQAAAEELGVSIDQIRLVMADSSIVPDDGGTAGSRTTPSTVPSVRQGCAAARNLLLDAAAKSFGVPRNQLGIQRGVASVIPGRPGPSSKTFSYADLVKGASGKALQDQVPADVRVVPVHAWEVMGAPVGKIGGRAIVTGQHQYPSDITRPDMLHGVVLRPPSYGAVLKRISMEKLTDMKDVVTVKDGNFIGFAAKNQREAKQARSKAAATAEWTDGGSASSQHLADVLREKSRNGRSKTRGKGAAGLEKSAKQLQATYFIPYVQHAPMEPRAAVAEWVDEKLTVWTGTQQPSRVQRQLAEAFGLQPSHVRVIVPDTGGGFGGKHTGETAVEAARLAKEAKRPVSVRWSREEEFTWAYFRPAGVMDLAGGLNAKGELTDWSHVNINSGGSALETPYNIPNVSTEYRSSNQPLRSGSYRALASTANVFARECFMDELAYASDPTKDPFEFRMRYLPEGRLKQVLKAVADRFDWKRRWTPYAEQRARGYGIACGTEKASYLATCAEVSVDHDQKSYKVENVCVAFECGAVQNPLNLHAQITGCVLQGMGPIIAESMQFENGVIQNPRFSQYQVPRFKDVPELDVVVLNRKEFESVGAGETPIIGIAPVVANAIYNACGQRLRSLPLELA
jgi:CO/xanthine dehydrogenase Mo-binding subunit